MAAKTEIETAKTRRQKTELETDVIIIVKGAGEQAEDDHLNTFLRGFWPAVKSLDKTATITQVSRGFEAYTPSPHNADGKSHKHVTEIRAAHKRGQQRIWLKEAYWENEVLPSGAIGNLSAEWRMASFVFANMFRNVVFSRNTKSLKKSRLEGHALLGWSRPGTRLTDYFGYYVSYFLLFLLVLLPFINTLTMHLWFDAALKNFFPQITGSSGLLFVVATGLIWAIAPAMEHVVLIKQYIKEGVLHRLPILPSWVLLALIYLLVSEPAAYLRFIVLLLALQVGSIAARSILWNQRTYANSDVDISEFYSYRDDGKKKFGRVDEFWITRLPFTPLLYRYLIFLTLPIAFVGTLLVSLLKWTRFLGGIGASLDKVLNTMFVGYMDDVVNYAMDPAQAHRVRSAVINDIVYFYNRPEVQRIHVVAHSQGTPITYETLFHFLDSKYQDKVLTYATLGSVLSYYHQARGMLDRVYHERFPVSESKKQNFPEDFKWMNFWNFSDPITEFYGLDEYTFFEKAPPLDDEYKRSRTSPTNIRTATSLAENHGEYWNNLEKFTLPLAKRVLGEMKPEEWAPGVKREKETSATKQLDWKHYAHHVYVLILWLAILAAAGIAVRWLSVTTVFGPLVNYFTALASAIASLLPKGPSPSPEISRVWTLILDGSQVLIGVWVVVDWFSQLRRALIGTD